MLSGPGAYIFSVAIVYKLTSPHTSASLLQGKASPVDVGYAVYDLELIDVDEFNMLHVWVGQVCDAAFPIWMLRAGILQLSCLVSRQL